MSIIELIFSLNVSDFSAPDPVKLQACLKKMQACKPPCRLQIDCEEKPQEDNYKLDSFQQYLKLKREKGGQYVEFQ